MSIHRICPNQSSHWSGLYDWWMTPVDSVRDGHLIDAGDGYLAVKQVCDLLQSWLEFRVYIMLFQSTVKNYQLTRIVNKDLY